MLAEHLRDSRTGEFSARLLSVDDKFWTTHADENSSSKADTAAFGRNLDSSTLQRAGSSTIDMPPIRETLTVFFTPIVEQHRVIFEETLKTPDGFRDHWQIDQPSSSTSLDLVETHLNDTDAVEVAVQNLFSLANFIDFEPGKTNDFQDGLEETIEKHGELALLEIQTLVLNGETKSAIAMEALQYVGNTESNTWRDARRLMLERCLLRSRSAWVRDGAGLGLASLDDPRSIAVLQKAILKETSRALKSDLTLVLDQLQATLQES